MWYSWPLPRSVLMHSAYCKIPIKVYTVLAQSGWSALSIHKIKWKFSLLPQRWTATTRYPTRQYFHVKSTTCSPLKCFFNYPVSLCGGGQGLPVLCQDRGDGPVVVGLPAEHGGEVRGRPDQKFGS